MYSLRSYFLKSKSFKVRTLPGCSVLTIENQKGACNQGKNWRNFYSVQSLVDTRLVNSIRAFVYAFIVELMHQRKHRHFASLRLKTMIVQARFARPSWTSGFLYFKGWTPLIIIFCCLSLSAIAPSCSVLRTRAPSYSYGVDPPPFRCIFR